MRGNVISISSSMVTVSEVETCRMHGDGTLHSYLGFHELQCTDDRQRVWHEWQLNGHRDLSDVNNGMWHGYKLKPKTCVGQLWKDCKCIAHDMSRCQGLLAEL